MKAAVYGGTERQSRRSGEVVPFDGLCDVPERFDASQEIRQSDGNESVK